MSGENLFELHDVFFNCWSTQTNAQKTRANYEASQNKYRFCI